jgi:hypothetical protein
MPTSEPTHIEQQRATWQLPWLRLSLIARRMSRHGDSYAEEIQEILALRRSVAQRGWFN